ncbi:3-oxoacyl-[acyl-carrier-protein] reductase [Maritalea myrionectae]|uniref:3-oxoacyl-[acyl-carrier-protein] reductase n=1 Tax=Maritalea myrionectae TaxID=454601 RepID=A0A2R4MG06_9HYPH|nr:SDR family NAD(P)-dependent oxidoreductase [Maritalea myrionectae]AVX04977.1 3-oxoacyl-[acyl-carrier-protein] reductase [Maritalea myrionectae]
MTDKNDLADRVVLITGASRGIGYFSAIEAAKRGAHVIAIARTVGGLEDLDDEIQAAGGSATLVPLDLLDGDAIDRMGGAIFERWGKLDGLMANAGMLGSISPISHLAPKEVDKVFKLNVTANFRLIRSLEPLLKQSDAGRVLFVSSSSAYSCKPYWGLYAASKAALNAMAKSYAGENANTKLNINVINPGPTRTQMRAKAVPGEDPETIPHPREVAPKFIDLISPDYTENGQYIDLKNDGKTSPL